MLLNIRQAASVLGVSRHRIGTYLAAGQLRDVATTAPGASRHVILLRQQAVEEKLDRLIAAWE